MRIGKGRQSTRDDVGERPQGRLDLRHLVCVLGDEVIIHMHPLRRHRQSALDAWRFGWAAPGEPVARVGGAHQVQSETVRSGSPARRLPQEQRIWADSEERSIFVIKRNDRVVVGSVGVGMSKCMITWVWFRPRLVWLNRCSQVVPRQCNASAAGQLPELGGWVRPSARGCQAPGE